MTKSYYIAESIHIMFMYAFPEHVAQLFNLSFIPQVLMIKQSVVTLHLNTEPRIDVIICIWTMTRD